MSPTQPSNRSSFSKDALIAGFKRCSIHESRELQIWDVCVRKEFGDHAEYPKARPLREQIHSEKVEHQAKRGRRSAGNAAHRVSFGGTKCQRT